MLHAPPPMHIPDGFLSALVALLFWALTIPVVGYALRRVNEEVGERQIPLMGVLAAAIFAGQMLNFPVAAGTSGHLMGAALAVIVLGPWASILVLTCVVAIQALLFQDGGVVALGANIFNMGIIGTAVAYTAYRSVRRIAGDRPWGLFAGGFVAGWLSIFISALAVALQLAASGRTPVNLGLPVIAAVHALIGVGEGLITAGALAFIFAARRDLVQAGAGTATGGRTVWVAGLLIALTLAVASPLASANPDGLEWVARQQGFIDTAQSPLYRLIPDYAIPGVSNQALATILAGVLGTLIVFAASAGVAYLRRQRRTNS